MEPTPEKSPNKIEAPFTAEQVENLNLYQISGVFHEFTCGNREHQGGGPMLMAIEQGWICPDRGCNYIQNWAHSFMADREAISKQYMLLNGNNIDSNIDQLKTMLEGYPEIVNNHPLSLHLKNK